MRAVANRDTALKGVAWILALGVFAGVGVLGYRAVLRERERAAEEAQQRAAEAAAAAAKPAPVIRVDPAEAAIERCKDAIARSFVLGGWKKASDICHEGEQDAAGNAEMRALLAGLRCLEWEVRAGDRRFDDDEPRPISDARLRTELHRWIRQDCDPEKTLEKLVPALPPLAACGLLLERLANQSDGLAIDQLDALSRLPQECQGSPGGMLFFEKLKPTAEIEAGRRCAELDTEGPSETIRLLRMCWRYVGLKYCPDLSVLQVPEGKTLQLEGKLKAKGWRPEDPLLVSMLRATPPEQRGGWACKNGSLVSYLLPAHRRPTGPIQVPRRK